MMIAFIIDFDYVYPKDPNLKKLILFEAHNSLSSIHLDYVKTLNAIRKSYFWPGMKRDVLNYVKDCLSCKCNKVERVRFPKKLQPLYIPKMKWKCISMDFIARLPIVQGGFHSIMVIVDLLTKVSHLIPIRMTYTTIDIA